MPSYVLTIDGPRKMTRYVSAGDDQAAIRMAKDSVIADFADEADPEVLTSALSLTCDEDGTDYRSTVGKMLGLSP